MARLQYGEALADDVREVGDIPVYGSNGKVGEHSRPNTGSPVIVVGRKGSFGKIQYSDRPVFAIDTTYFVDASQTRTHMRWLYYALQTLRLDRLSEDVGVPGLSRERAYSERLGLPPIDVQRGIADFLDLKTALIDSLIAAKRRMIELLDEHRRQTVWMLTRHGLADLKERDTRVPWIGQIPQHWNIAPLKRLGHITSGVTFPPKYQGVSGEELGYLKVSDFNATANAREITSTSHTVSRKTAAHLGAYIFPIGTVIFPKIGAALLLNRRRVLAIACCADQNLMGMVLRQGNWRYFAWQLEGVDVSRLAMPGPIPFINEDEVGEIVVAVPPFEEQDQIAQRLDRTMGKIELAIGRAEGSIDLLVERRQALVAAAVTGELPVLGQST